MENMEFKANIPIIEKFDVIVIGGGPAGIAAAISASRQGARTAIIERYGALGGNLTIGQVNPILGAVETGTIYDEIISLLKEEHLDEQPVVTRNGNEIHIDPEEAKMILTNLVVESGAELFLQVPVIDVIKEDSKVSGVVLNSPKGLVAFKGTVIIDATGDGYVANLAGAPWQMGRDSDGRVQPVSLEFIIDQVDENIAISCFGGSDKVTLPNGKMFSEFCKEASKRGELPTNVTIVRLHKTFYPGERNVNATQVNDCNPLELKDITNAEIELRKQVYTIVGFLRKNVPGYEKCRVKSSASTLGIRESRRIVGEYILCDEDVESGTKFDDVVVHNAWFLIDIHNPNGGGQAEGHSKPAKKYDIPYRCLVPRDIDNLLVAGRCISGTHRAHASYRVMAICMAVGQAAGIAAAISAKERITPRMLPYKKVQIGLQEQGAKLFD